MKISLKLVGRAIANGAHSIKNKAQTAGALVAEGVRNVKHHTFHALNVRAYTRVDDGDQPEPPMTAKDAIDQALALVNALEPDAAMNEAVKKPSHKTVALVEIENHISDFRDALLKAKKNGDQHISYDLENAASWIITHASDDRHWQNLSAERRAAIVDAALMIRSNADSSRTEY